MLGRMSYRQDGNLIQSYPFPGHLHHVRLDKVTARYYGFETSTHYEVCFMEWDGYNAAKLGIPPHYISHGTEFFSLDNLSGAIRALAQRTASDNPASPANLWENVIEKFAERRTDGLEIERRRKYEIEREQG